MSGPLDPQDAYWAELRKSPVFAHAWNAALWEASKLINDCPPLTREDVMDALRYLAMDGAS